MKLRVGIVTIMDYTNYGNRLQNYAVYKILHQNYKCDVISLCVNKEKRFCNADYVAWCKERAARLSCVIPRFAEKCFGNNITRWVNFTRWSRRIPTKIFYDMDCLPVFLNEKFDEFFVGSDQVWNYRFFSYHADDYFLKFAKDQKKNAISGSFGVDALPEEWKETYRKELAKFNNISVREEAGQKIIKDLLGIEVPVLIDPTMMLTKDEWLRVSRKPRVDCSKPYVLKYYLGDEAENEKIDIWAKEKGYEVYELLNKDIPELYSAGPGEFISLISNATLICSDSFHCIVFSIIFSRPFVVYARKGKEDYMTSRMDTLLKKFEFEDRWKDLLSKEEYLKCDFSHVPAILNVEQKKFTDYVSGILK